MRTLIVLTPLLLAACADGTVGPSLAKRPIESRSLQEPVREAAPAPPADTGLQSQIDEQLNRARAGQRDFSALLPRVQASASAAGAEGSETWVAAQQLLSALETARGEATAALGRLDALIAERVLSGQDSGLTELQAAQREVNSLADQQRDAFEAVRARVNR